MLTPTAIKEARVPKNAARPQGTEPSALQSTQSNIFKTQNATRSHARRADVLFIIIKKARPGIGAKTIVSTKRLKDCVNASTIHSRNRVSHIDKQHG
jgi:hypothetical protein